MKWIIASCITVVATCVPAFATETGTLSCDRGIVSIGDSALEVVSKCGEPTLKSQREEKSVDKGAKNHGEKTVKYDIIDDWSYNFGPKAFQYRLILENQRVVRIESLDIGY